MPVRHLSAIASVLVLGGLLASWVRAGAAEPAASGPAWIRFDGVEGDLSGEFTASGHVVVVWEEYVLKADRVTMNFKTKDVSASGQVQMVRFRQPPTDAEAAAAQPVQAGDLVWSAESIKGNLNTREFSAGANTLNAAPWYYGGTRGALDRDRTLRLWDADLTTCDHELSGSPHWGLRARKLALERDGHYLAEHVYLHVLGVPVFYLPGLMGNRHRFGQYEFRAGSSSDWGYWLRLGRRFQVGDQLQALAFAEYRERRGPAAGFQGTWRRPPTASRFLLYGLRDDDPLVDVAVNGRVYNGRYAPHAERFRLADFTRWELPGDLTLRAKLDYQSDNDLLFEFFRHEYDLNPEPESYADLSWLAARYEVSLNYRPRVNPFTSVVERLPELRLELPRQALGASGWYYQGTTTVAQLRMNFRDYELPRFDGQPDNSDYATVRADSLHALYLPLRADWLQFVPRVAGRFTYYGDSSQRPVSAAELAADIAADQRRGSPADTTPVTAYDDAGGERLRWAAELGTEASFTAQRTWADFRSPRLDADGLRHVVEPYVNYTWLPRPSEDRDHLYFFDDTDRLAPVSFLRLGVGQELETRTAAAAVPRRRSLARLDNFVDYFFRPEADQPHWGDFGSVLGLSPAPAVEFTGKASFATSDWQLQVLNVGARYGEPERWNVGVNYLRRGAYTQRDAYSMASDLDRVFASGIFPLTFDRSEGITGTVNLPLAERWRLTTEHRYDLMDHELTSQRYSLSRDLHCWVGAVAYTRNNVSQTVEVVLYLKAFPQTAARLAEDFGNPHE